MKTLRGVVQVSGFANSAEIGCRAPVVAGRVSDVKSVKKRTKFSCIRCLGV